MKEKYLETLRNALEKEGIQNIDDILDSYSSKFDLGHEAGLTDEEIEEQLGTIEDILFDYTKKEDVKERYTISLELASFSEFEIVRSKNAGIDFEMDRKAWDNVKIIRGKNSVSLKADTFKNGHFEGTMYIGDDIDIETLVIDNYSADVNITSLSGKNFVFTNKSGDIHFDGIEAEEKIVINNVSGDFMFQILSSPMLLLNTVSGDVSIRELVCDKVQASIVSGDISIRHSNSAIYVIDSVSGDFKVEDEMDAENIKFTSVSGDCYIAGRPLGKNISAQIQDAFKKMKF